MSPTVSVVIPAYNAMAYLPETLASVLNQTLSDFEVIIVDDGSKDAILEWATTITDPRVKVISQPNQGVSAARNTGIQASRGEYIAFLDADDIWVATKLEKQVQRFQAQPELGLVYTWTQLIDAEGTLIDTILHSSVDGEAWKNLLVFDPIGNGSSAMIPRHCFETVGLFDTALSTVADRDMWFRIARHYPFGTLEECLTLYRQHGNSMVRNRKKLLDEMRVVIDRSFSTAPTELLYLRNKAYGYIFMWQAWEAYAEGAFDESRQLRKQAVLHDARLRYSQNLARLRVKTYLKQNFSKVSSLSRRPIGA